MSATLTETASTGKRPRGARRKLHMTPMLCGLAVVLCTVLVEMVLFNLPFWQTMNASPITVDDYAVGEGISRDGDTLTIESNDNAYIEVKTDSTIEYLYMDPGESPTDVTLQFQLVTQHVDNTGWYTGETTKYMNLAYDDSRYVRVGGEHDGVRINFIGAQGQQLTLRHIVVNPQIPFSVSVLRVALIAVCLVYCLFLRPGAGIYRIRLSSRVGSIRCRQTWVLAAVTAVQLAIVCGVWHFAGGGDAAASWPQQIFGFTTDYDQYARMGDALLHGRVSLDLPVSDSLASLANPYDSDIRGQAMGEGGGPIFWDHAFYDGEYYMYFGVVPAVLLFVPFQLITGGWLASAWAILLLGLLTTVAMTCFVVQVADKLFRRTISLGATILAIVALNAGSSMYYQLFTPNFYAVPGLASLCFTVAGLTFWLMSKKGASVSKIPLALGSTCIALNLGCRPQFILVAVLALPLFWDELVHRRLFFSRKGIGNTVAALLPFVVVFTPLLAYNAIRFGSPLDFGANYNLTGFDMTVMKTPLIDIIPLLLYYLFQPANITMGFPFVGTTQTPLPLWAPAEASVGGVLAICPFLVVVFFAVSAFRTADNAIRRTAFGVFLLGLVILVVDCYMTGFAWRYYLDFSWAFCIIAVMVVFLHDRRRMEAVDSVSTDGTIFSAVILRVFFIGVLLSELFQFFSLLAPGRMTPMISVCPDLFYEVMRWFLALN